MRKSMPKYKRGQILLLTVIIIALFMAAISSFIILILAETKSQDQMNNSMLAYYAAEAGAEMGIATKVSGPLLPVSLPNNATYIYTVSSTSVTVGTVTTTTYVIKSTGAKDNIKRQLQVTVVKTDDMGSGTPMTTQAVTSWQETNPSIL